MTVQARCEYCGRPRVPGTACQECEGLADGDPLALAGGPPLSEAALGVAPGWPEEELRDDGGEPGGLALAADRRHDGRPNSLQEASMAKQAREDQETLGGVELRRSDVDDYEVGAEVNGVWVSFARIPGAQVRANVENAQATAEAAGNGS